MPDDYEHKRNPESQLDLIQNTINAAAVDIAHSQQRLLLSEIIEIVENKLRDLNLCCEVEIRFEPVNYDAALLSIQGSENLYKVVLQRAKIIGKKYLLIFAPNTNSANR